MSKGEHWLALVSIAEQGGALVSTAEHCQALVSTDEHCQAKESTAEHWRALPSKGAYKSYGFMTLDMVKKCLYAPGRTGRTKVMGS